MRRGEKNELLSLADSITPGGLHPHEVVLRLRELSPQWNASIRQEEAEVLLRRTLDALDDPRREDQLRKDIEDYFGDPAVIFGNPEMSGGEKVEDAP